MNQEAKPTGGRSGAGYTEEFKRSVVDHWCHSEKTAEQVGKEFGVKIWNVRDWRRRYGPTHKPVDAPMPEKPEELKRELQQLRKELARSAGGSRGQKLNIIDALASPRGIRNVHRRFCGLWFALREFHL
jgi:transposase-like protein